VRRLRRVPGSDLLGSGRFAKVNIAVDPNVLELLKTGIWDVSSFIAVILNSICLEGEIHMGATLDQQYAFVYSVASHQEVSLGATRGTSLFIGRLMKSTYFPAEF